MMLELDSDQNKTIIQKYLITLEYLIGGRFDSVHNNVSMPITKLGARNRGILLQHSQNLDLSSSERFRGQVCSLLPSPP
jgi:hypothetical protein